MTEADIKKVAKEAVKETLLTMGIDINDPKAITEMQADFQHLRSWRQSVKTVQRQSLKAAVGIILSGIAGLIYMALHR